MFRPIYPPRTRAYEYCPLAVNIYDSCPHGCTYCYARAMAKRFGRPWGNEVNPRPGIVEAVQKQLVGMRGQGKKIMLCFTCDPYPLGYTKAGRRINTTATREVIRAIKESGNHVQILTKGHMKDAQRDFDLLDENDKFGVTLTGASWEDEPGAVNVEARIRILRKAAAADIGTWVSCEPVLDPAAVYAAIESLDCVDMFHIGKLNHRKSNIDWHQFGHDVEALCQRLGRNYYIKDDLRREMGE